MKDRLSVRSILLTTVLAASAVGSAGAQEPFKTQPYSEYFPTLPHPARPAPPILLTFPSVSQVTTDEALGRAKAAVGIYEFSGGFCSGVNTAGDTNPAVRHCVVDPTTGKGRTGQFGHPSYKWCPAQVVFASRANDFAEITLGHCANSFARADETTTAEIRAIRPNTPIVVLNFQSRPNGEEKTIFEIAAPVIGVTPAEIYVAFQGDFNNHRLDRGGSMGPFFIQAGNELKVAGVASGVSKPGQRVYNEAQRTFGFSRSQVTAVGYAERVDLRRGN